MTRQADAIRAAYLAGWNSWRTNSDWDDAQARFSANHCRHAASAFCKLEHAWADGWSDRSESRPKWHALDCPKGITGPTNPDGHEDCEVPA